MAKFKRGEEVRVLSVNGRPTTKGVVIAPPFALPFYFIRVEGPHAGEWPVREENLRKLLPPHDTYRPADISIDDLMRSIRETEHV